MGVITKNTLRLIMWSSAAMAVLAFVPWLDKHTLELVTDRPPVVMTALGDAVLFASIALVCAFFASRMLHDPSELLWAGLVVAAAALFVMAGAELSESAKGCSNGSILGIVNTDFGFGCPSHGSSVSTGTAVGWLALATSLLTALVALCLPVLETAERQRIT